MANLKFHNSQTNEWEEIKVSTRLKDLYHTTKLTQDQNYVDIGVTNFNPNEDVVFSICNSTWLQKDDDFIVNGGLLRIESKDGSNWKNGDTFNFVVLKNVDKDALPSADGSLIQDGSITIAKLATTLQTAINKVGTTALTTTATTLSDAINELDASLSENTQNIAQLSNPNLLINGDFQVWQRGISFNNLYQQYSADRWYCSRSGGTSTIAKVSNGLSITASETVFVNQFVENSLALKDMMMAFSASIDGVKYIVTGKPSDNPSIDVPKGKLSFGFNTTRNVVAGSYQISSGNAIINWVKLELGSKATPFVPRLYAEELTLCKRHYQIMKSGGVAFSTSLLPIHTTYPVEMRSLPSTKISFQSDVSNVDYFGMGSIAIGSYTLVNITNNSLDYCACPSNPFVVGGQYDFTISLDAEIY